MDNAITTRRLTALVSLMANPLFSLVRTVHVVAAVVWLGGLWLSSWFHGRLYHGMSEEAVAEFGGRMARALTPWLGWGGIVTMGLGVLVLAELGLRVGWANLSPSVVFGGALALVVWWLQSHGVLSVLRPWAKAAIQPGPDARARVGRIGLVASVLSALVAVVMVGGTRIRGVFG